MIGTGTYYFKLFLLTIRGFTQKLEILPIVVNMSTKRVHPDLAEKFFSMGLSDFSGAIPKLETTAVESADATVLEYLSKKCACMRDDLRDRNRQRTKRRVSSLEQTYKVLANQLDEQIAKLSDARIIRMKMSQKERLLTRKQEQVRELNDRIELSIETEEIAGGLIIAAPPGTPVRA